MSCYFSLSQISVEDLSWQQLMFTAKCCSYPLLLESSAKCSAPQALRYAVKATRPICISVALPFMELIAMMCEVLHINQEISAPVKDLMVVLAICLHGGHTPETAESVRWCQCDWNTQLDCLTISTDCTQQGSTWPEAGICIQTSIAWQGAICKTNWYAFVFLSWSNWEI